MVRQFLALLQKEGRFEETGASPIDLMEALQVHECVHSTARNASLLPFLPPCASAGVGGKWKDMKPFARRMGVQLVVQLFSYSDMYFQNNSSGHGRDKNAIEGKGRQYTNMKRSTRKHAFSACIFSSPTSMQWKRSEGRTDAITKVRRFQSIG